MPKSISPTSASDKLEYDIDFIDLISHIDPGIYKSRYYRQWTILMPYVPLSFISAEGKITYVGAEGFEYNDMNDAILSHGKSTDKISIDEIINAYKIKNCIKYPYMDIMEVLEEMSIFTKYNKNHINWHGI